MIAGETLESKRPVGEESTAHCVHHLASKPNTGRRGLGRGVSIEESDISCCPHNGESAAKTETRLGYLGLSVWGALPYA
jgi:hypothetical protein